MPSKRFFFSSFCLIFSSICMVIFISPVVFMAFSFHSFLLLKLIDCIVFHLQIFLKRLISLGIIFSLLLATLQVAVYFNFINRLIFFSSLSLLCLFASVVVLSAKRKICLGLLKRRFYLVKLAEKADG